MNTRETKHFDNASEFCNNLHFTFFIKSFKINPSERRESYLTWVTNPITVRNLKIYPNINTVKTL